LRAYCSWALSLHLDRLVEKNHEHLLGLSRATLTSFVIVLVASLMIWCRA
jgi:hypothetical protein